MSNDSSSNAQDSQSPLDLSAFYVSQTDSPQESQEIDVFNDNIESQRPPRANAELPAPPYATSSSAFITMDTLQIANVDQPETKMLKSFIFKLKC